jgi:hypothetical protein
MRYLHICLAAGMITLAAWTSAATPREVDGARARPVSPQQAIALHASTSASIRDAGWIGWPARSKALDSVPEHGTLALLGSAMVLMARRLRKTPVKPGV